MAFRFRLSKVLEWYDRQYQLEASRLRQCAEGVATAQLELSRHRESRMATEGQIFLLESLHGNDLRAREFHRQQAMAQESRLMQICHRAQKELETQRATTLSAQCRVRLVEKLRDRKCAEHDYLASRELEEIAASSWLAGFTRNLIQDEAFLNTE